MPFFSARSSARPPAALRDFISPVWERSSDYPKKLGASDLRVENGDGDLLMSGLSAINPVQEEDSFFRPHWLERLVLRLSARAWVEVRRSRYADHAVRVARVQSEQLLERALDIAAVVYIL